MANNNAFVSLMVLAILIIFDVLSLVLFSFNVVEFLIVVFVSLFMFLILVFVLISTSRRKIVRSSMTKKSESQKKMLVVPNYNYIGSTETKKYHTRNCRLAKLIKKRFALYDNSPEFFKTKKFKPCKICLKKQTN